MREDGLPKGTLLKQSYEGEGFSGQTYKIDKQLGYGSFGITYLAIDIDFGHKVVIKECFPKDESIRTDGNTISPRSTSESSLFDWCIERFFDEAKLLHEFKHPNIVRVTGLFHANGTAYFVMPYVGGITLCEWFKKHPKAKEAELVSILKDLFSGLDYSHQRKVVHRDIKPENIIITPEGKPILIDFGAARELIGKGSQTGSKVLTPHFASYEQELSKKVTPATDYYGLSATFYACITNSLVPEAKNRADEVYMNQGFDPYQPLAENSEYTRRYSIVFCQAIDAGLAIKPENRPQTSKAFLVMIEGDTPTPKPDELLNEKIAASVVDDVINSQAYQQLLASAKKLDIKQTEAKRLINELAQENGWHVEEKKPKPEPTLKPDEPPTDTEKKPSAIKRIFLLLAIGGLIFMSITWWNSYQKEQKRKDARIAREQAACQDARGKNTITAWQNYQKNYPYSNICNEAAQQIANLKKQQAETEKQQAKLEQERKGIIKAISNLSDNGGLEVAELDEAKDLLKRAKQFNAKNPQIPIKNLDKLEEIIERVETRSSNYTPSSSKSRIRSLLKHLDQ